MSRRTAFSIAEPSRRNGIRVSTPRPETAYRIRAATASRKSMWSRPLHAAAVAAGAVRQRAGLAVGTRLVERGDGMRVAKEHLARCATIDDDAGGDHTLDEALIVLHLT